MHTATPEISRAQKFRRAIFNWRAARRALLALAVFATGLAIFYTEEDWRGQRDWEATKAQLVAEGQPLAFEQMQPPLVPDDQNFAMAPIIKSLNEPTYEVENKLLAELSWGPGLGRVDDLYDKAGFRKPGAKFDLSALKKAVGQDDVLAAMKKFGPLLDEFTAASHRPYARFPLSMEPGHSTDLPLNIFLELAKVYTLRARLELDQDQAPAAADDILTALRLAKHLTSLPTLTAQLVADAMSVYTLPPILDGLTAHRWTDAQLVELIENLQNIDFVAAMQRGFQGVLVNGVQVFELYASNGKMFMMARALASLPKDGQNRLLAAFVSAFPHGWLLQNQIVYVQDTLQRIHYFDPARHRIDVAAADADAAEWARRKYTPLNFLGLVMSRNMTTLATAAAPNIAQFDEATVACALERYRLANGKLPDQLEELTPKYLAKIPADVVSGGPMGYKVRADGHFVLGETGPNGRDDGGMEDVKKGRDDVVWVDGGG